MSQRITLVCVPPSPDTLEPIARYSPASRAEHLCAMDLYARMRVLTRLAAVDACGTVRGLHRAGTISLIAGVASAMAGRGRTLAPLREMAMALAAGTPPIRVIRDAESAAPCSLADVTRLALRQQGQNRIMPIACLFEARTIAVIDLLEAAANVAARQLPVVFVCERASERVPGADSSCDAPAEIATALGLPVVTVDGTDPHAVRRAVVAAAEAALRGSPSLLEACTHAAPGGDPRWAVDPAEALRYAACAGGVVAAHDFARAARAIDAWVRDAGCLLTALDGRESNAPELSWTWEQSTLVEELVLFSDSAAAAS